MLDYSRTRGEDVRALTRAIALGSGAGLLIGVVYLAGSGGHASDAKLPAGSRPASAVPLISALQHPATRVRLPAAAAPQAIPTAMAGQTPNFQALRDRVRLAALDLHKPAEPFQAERVSATGSDLHCLAEAVYFEARGEEQPGQQAVAQVVLNRVRHPAFPKTICGVVHQRTASGCQFSFACGSQTAQTGGTAWRRAEAVATAEMHGAVMTAVGDATHFQTAHAGAFTGLLKVAQIGAHVFYRFAGHAGAASMFHQTPSPSAGPANIQLAQLDTTSPSAKAVDPVRSAPPAVAPVTSVAAIKPAAVAPKLVSTPVADPKAVTDVKAPVALGVLAPAPAAAPVKAPVASKAVIPATTLAQS